MSGLQENRSIINYLRSTIAEHYSDIARICQKKKKAIITMSAADCCSCRESLVSRNSNMAIVKLIDIN